MSTLERELVERISRLDEEKQRKVLEFVQAIEESLEEKNILPKGAIEIGSSET